MSAYATGLIGILIALGLLIFLAFRGYTLLLAAPAAAIVAAAFSREPILAKWTLTFMQGTPLPWVALSLPPRAGRASAA
jgi:H+/gluconate symporter-like permease